MNYFLAFGYEVLDLLPSVEYLFLSLRALSAVLRAALEAVSHASGVERTTNDVITYTRKVLHTAAAHHHDGVLLQVVTLAGDVSVHLFLVGQAHTCHLTHSRVRLFGSGGVNTYADATTLRAAVKCRRLALVNELFSTFSNQLLNCRHLTFFS